MAADPNELGPGDRLGGFRIERRIGVGGMGVVYLAEDERLGRKVALKVIAPQLAHDREFQRRFEGEARNAAAIDDHHVVPIFSAGSADGRLYIAMRFVDGTDLRSVLDQSAPLESEAATAIVGDVASALDAAHAAGLVHRDVKPANILLTGEPGAGTAYLTDFGLTKGLQGGGTALTGTGLVIGTVDYMAPEQWLPDGRVDARTDVYALGCVLHEMLAGSVPFPGSDHQKMWGHVNEALPALADGGPHPLDPVVARATAKQQDDRYPSASDLARAAEAAAAGTANTTVERSVATGAAASGMAESDPSANPTRTMRSPSPPPSPPPAQPATAQMEPPRGSGPGGGERSRGLGAAALIGAAVLVAAGLVAAALVVSGGTGDPSPGAQPVASRERVPSGAKAEEPAEEPGTKPAVDPEASSSGAEEATTVSRGLYSVAIPDGWGAEEVDEDQGAYYQSTWHDPTDYNTSILIDSETPASGDPVASAESVRDEVVNTSYVEGSLLPTTLAGRPAARWVFDLEGDRRVDYFLYECDVGLAIRGSTSPANFGAMAATFHEVAASATVPCGE